jgi:acetolactate synthase small subunit
MNIVPLTNKTVDYVSKAYLKDVTFVLKVFDMTEYIKFKELALIAFTAKGKKLEKAMISVVGMGVVDVKGVEGDTIKLPPFMYEDLVNRITVVNKTTSKNVKK